MRLNFQESRFCPLNPPDVDRTPALGLCSSVFFFLIRAFTLTFKPSIPFCTFALSRRPCHFSLCHQPSRITHRHHLKMPLSARLLCVLMLKCLRLLLCFRLIILLLVLLIFILILILQLFSLLVVRS